jgi:hypothetical protein
VVGAALGPERPPTWRLWSMREWAVVADGGLAALLVPTLEPVAANEGD